MGNLNDNIDKLVSKILNEEVENKVKGLAESKGLWTEIETKENLKGGQKKLDVAEPKGKLDAADFKKLRDKKKETKEQEMDEFYFDGEDDEEMENPDFFGNDQRPTLPGREGFHVTHRPKMMGSFNDEHGFYDETNRQYTGDFDFDFDEEEFDNFDDFDSKYGGKQAMFARGDEGRKFFDAYKDKYKSPFRVRTRRDMEEAETEEGNAFSGALAKAKESGKDSFEVDGKKYNVKESKKTSLKLTEEELIDLIESIVLEQTVKDKDEKANISKNSPEGLKKTDKVLGLSKRQNDDYAKEVVKKMTDYMKDMVSGDKKYDENPDDFPQSNYDMEKEHNEKKYHPSEAVEEYIEAFAYPGMTNLVYDEIKPDEEMIEKQIKGDAKNGNAITGSDGKALGNVSKRSEKTGERFKKNFEENLYGAEQQKGSYKRQSQPVDVAGDKRQGGGLKDSSASKAQKIMNQLESTEDKNTKVIAEEMNKMKNLIGYNRKTQ